MWTRYDLKMNAKMAFKRNYWTCVTASLVVGVLSGSMFAGSGSGVQTTLELSQQMMDGHKMEAFVLELAFFGWFLLSALTCGLVGIFYVNPYLDATFAEFYVAIRTESIGKGLVAEGELPGYSAQTV